MGKRMKIGKWMILLALPGQMLALVYHIRMIYIDVWSETGVSEWSLHALAIAGALLAWLGLWRLAGDKTMGFGFYVSGRALVWGSNACMAGLIYGLKTSLWYAAFWFLIWAVFPVLIYWFYFRKVKKKPSGAEAGMRG